MAKCSVCLLRKLASTHVAGGSVGAPVPHPAENIKLRCIKIHPSRSS